MSILVTKLKNFSHKVIWKHLAVFLIVALLCLFVFNFVFAKEHVSDAQNALAAANEEINSADLQGKVISVLTFIAGFILPVITSVLGAGISILSSVVIDLFRVQNFVDSSVVLTGWVITRDISNIALIVALILIAGQSVIGLGGNKVNLSQKIIQLITAAILINFSRLIAGIVIDLAQVLMMTFVNAFESLASGNLQFAFHVQDMLNLSEDLDPNVNVRNEILGAAILTVFMLMVSFGLLLSYTFVLVERIIGIWIYLVFAPFAYIAPLLPGTEGFSAKWWGEFMKYVFMGPALAFMFWLAMAVLSKAPKEGFQMQKKDFVYSEDAKTPRNASEVSSPYNIASFIGSIAVMMAGLGLAKQVGTLSGAVIPKLKSLGKKGLGMAGKTVAVGAGAGALGLMAGLAMASKKSKPSESVPSPEFSKSSSRDGAEAARQVRLSENIAKYQSVNASSGKTSDELKQDYLSSKKAKKAYSKPLTSGERTQFGVKVEHSGEVGVKYPQNLNKQFNTKENELSKFQGIKAKGSKSPTGVTAGKFSKGGGVAAVNFDEFGPLLEGKLKNEKGGPLDLNSSVESANLRGVNAEAAKTEIVKMYEQQIKTLEGAKTPFEKEKALAAFGYKPDKPDKPDKMVEKILMRSKKRLEEMKVSPVGEGGITLVNKGRIAEPSLRKLTGYGNAHHEFMRNDTTNRDMWKKIVATASPKLVELADSHTAKRSDAGSMSGSQKLEVYAADIMGGRVPKNKHSSEFLKTIKSSGLLGDSVRRRTNSGGRETSGVKYSNTTPQ